MLKLVNLDADTRLCMKAEFEDDVNEAKLYMPSWLSERGQKDWPGLLNTAIESGDDVTLGFELKNEGRLVDKYKKKKPNSEELIEVAVPVIGHLLVAETEFNRFYARGLCRRAWQKGIKNVIVYRAKEVKVPRPESIAKIGVALEAAKLLDSLRKDLPSVVEDLPIGPGSGLSIMLPDTKVA